MGKNIPKGWINYKPMSKVLSKTPFIAFKVPLNPSVCYSLPVDEHFTIEILLNEYPNLGLIIDLTNTTRYYNPAEFKNRGIKYCKIYLKGHGQVPGSKDINSFTNCVNKFREEDPSRLIGVHCTHGLNRTGYMICKYLIQCEGFASHEAIKLFEDARGYKMERENLVQSIKSTKFIQNFAQNQPGSSHKQSCVKNQTYPSCNNVINQRSNKKHMESNFHNDTTNQFHASSSNSYGQPSGSFNNGYYNFSNSRYNNYSNYGYEQPSSSGYYNSGYNNYYQRNSTSQRFYQDNSEETKRKFNWNPAQNRFDRAESSYTKLYSRRIGAEPYQDRNHGKRSRNKNDSKSNFENGGYGNWKKFH